MSVLIFHKFPTSTAARNEFLPCFLGVSKNAIQTKTEYQTAHRLYWIDPCNTATTKPTQPREQSSAEQSGIRALCALWKFSRVGSSRDKSFGQRQSEPFREKEVRQSLVPEFCKVCISRLKFGGRLQSDPFVKFGTENSRCRMSRDRLPELKFPELLQQQDCQ